MKLLENNDTKFFVLGGLGEVGRNMYCLMHEGEIIIIDSGVAFPEDGQLGIDYIIPDFSFLKKHENKIKCLLITHGHEDHIGAIPYLLQNVKIPVIYAPNQACHLIKRKLEDRNVKYNKIVTYNDETKLKFKHFEVEFFMTTHSIPDSHGISITTPNGVVVTTGDFKFDLTPIGPMADIHKMAEIGKKGVALLISDSTNAMNEGVSISESKVDGALGDIFKNNDSRIIIATFASNIYRLKHIVESCKKNNRKIAIFGRSMENQIDIAIEGGYIDGKDVFVSPEVANTLKPSEVCILCTGSQGEPLAALSRIADGIHRTIKLMPNDVVVFSSSPIPGNNASISKTINKLYLKGVKVYTTAILSDLHTSGHANQEELKWMIRLMKPTYFMPFHGEYRMLKQHADLAISCGIPKKNTFILDNGDVLSINKGNISKVGNFPVTEVYVDGNRIGDIGGIVLKDRKIMSSDGILAVIVNLDTSKNKLLIRPNITTRGFVLINENAELLKEIELLSERIINDKIKSKRLVFQDIKNELIQTITPFVYEKTGRKPIILPVIMDVKKDEVPAKA